MNTRTANYVLLLLEVRDSQEVLWYVLCLENTISYLLVQKIKWCLLPNQSLGMNRMSMKQSMNSHAIASIFPTLILPQDFMYQDMPAALSKCFLSRCLSRNICFQLVEAIDIA